MVIERRLIPNKVKLGSADLVNEAADITPKETFQ